MAVLNMTGGGGGGGGLDTSDATAFPKDILQGLTAYARGTKITGIMQDPQRPYKIYVPREHLDYSFMNFQCGANIVPTMTGYTTPEGIVTASSIYSTTYLAWYAFNRSTSNSWRSTTSVCTIAYALVTAKICNCYSIYPYNTSYCPSAWTFEGSLNGVWTVLDTRTGIDYWSYVRYFQCDNSTAYEAYRLSFTAGGATIRLYGIQFLEAA